MKLKKINKKGFESRLKRNLDKDLKSAFQKVYRDAALSIGRELADQLTPEWEVLVNHDFRTGIFYFTVQNQDYGDSIELSIDPVDNGYQTNLVSSIWIDGEQVIIRDKKTVVQALIEWTEEHSDSDYSAPEMQRNITWQKRKRKKA